ncbi:MAG: CMP-N,N'-diacetyllegionaminic acid synthase [Candidatus Brocadia fulgida]|nr:CMP-N,N'-diacetyllegionaminic acid synthase [Candidatus Brocadia fulgida]
MGAVQKCGQCPEDGLTGMTKIKTVAVIPARGGSKRIPGKNLMNFMGKPLIVWTIEAALRAGIFQRIVVSTDDEKVAAVATGHGIEVPFLRKEASDDVSPVSAATISALKQAGKFWNEEYDVVIQLMANCPLRGSAEIGEAYHNFVKHDFCFQLSAFRFGWMNPWWAAKINSDHRPEFIFPEALKKRSQDLDALYCPTGAIWIARVDKLLQENTFYGNDYRFFPMDWKAAVDIDTYEDVEFAKALYTVSRTAAV